METLKIFRDYTVLIVAGGMNIDRYKDMIKPLLFGRIEATDQDNQAPAQIKKLNPKLVMVSRNLKVFSGIQLLTGIRREEGFSETAFLIVGQKEDLAKGGLAEKAAAMGHARLIDEPLSEEKVHEAVMALMEGLIDQDREKAYGVKDQAREAAGNENFEDAAKLYRESLDLYDQDVDCWLGLGRALFQSEQYDDVEAAFFKALELNGSSLKAFLGLAELYEAQDEPDLAVDVLNQALAIAQQMKTSGQNKARVQMYIGDFELRLKKLTEAEEAFNAAIQNDPENAELRAEIGDAYADKGYYEESEKHYEDALAMDQDLAHTFNRLGIAYRKQGKYERALELYNKARIRHPEDEHLMFNMARTHYEMEDWEPALGLLETVIAMQPDLKPAKVLAHRCKSAMSGIELDIE